MVLFFDLISNVALYILKYSMITLYCQNKGPHFDLRVTYKLA